MSLIDEPWSLNLAHPSRYLGNEVNSVRKDPGSTELWMALAFPDLYEVGMSHLGLKILYHLLNRLPWLAAERVFSPDIDLEKELRLRGLPLSTLETHRPLCLCDIVGFSIQHELCYTNVLTMLNLSGIPLLAEKRQESHPLIIAGGPASLNPEPGAEIFDAIVIGDGEETALELCRVVRDAKKKADGWRGEALARLRRIRGVYVPSFFEPQYHSDGTLRQITPLKEGYEFVQRAIVPDIGRYPYPEQQIVPYTELIHDRLSIEITRGCTRGCRFCQAGMIYRPVRERGLSSILDTADRALKATGYEDLSLLSLSSGDHSSIEPLLKSLMDRQFRKRISISLPSLRADSLTPTLVAQIRRVRKTGFTLAPEAGSERLRRVINKGLSHRAIIETSKAVYAAGWNLIKLYFMIGLPGEEEHDLSAIVDLAKQIVALSGKKGKRPRLNVSVSTFVPKAHTPFMWSPQISLRESRRRISQIRRGLEGQPVRVKWNQPEMSRLEGIFSRGDRRLTPALIEAWKLGARFDAWSDHFKEEAWEKAFQRTGTDPDFYLARARESNEILPWSHIRTGVKDSFLRREWEKARDEEATADCREKCHECGVCDHREIDPVLFKGAPLGEMPEVLRGDPEYPRDRTYRLFFQKVGPARVLSHLELSRVFVRAFRREDLPLVYSKGYHPLPKVSFACALPVGTESTSEILDLTLAQEQDAARLKERLNAQLPHGIRVLRIQGLSSGSRKAKLKKSRYTVFLNGVNLKKEDLEDFLASSEFPIGKSHRRGPRVVDARSLVETMHLLRPNRVTLTVRHGNGPQLKPAEIVKGVFHLEDAQLEGIRILKAGQVLC